MAVRENVGDDGVHSRPDIQRDIIEKGFDRKVRMCRSPEDHSHEHHVFVGLGRSSLHWRKLGCRSVQSHRSLVDFLIQFPQRQQPGRVWLADVSTSSRTSSAVDGAALLFLVAAVGPFEIW